MFRRQLSSQKTWLLLAGLGSVFLVALVVLADSGRLPRWLPWVYQTPGLDKLIHLALMAGLVWAFRRGLPAASTTLVIVLVVLVTLEEFSQAWLPTRRADWLDWGSDLLGLALGLWCSRSPRLPPAASPSHRSW